MIDLQAVQARYDAYIAAMLGKDDLTAREVFETVWKSADDVPHLLTEIRRLRMEADGTTRKDSNHSTL